MKKKTQKQLEKEAAREAKKSSISDPMSLEGVGLGPAQIKNLNAEGIYSTFQLIHKNPVWLHHVTDYDKDKCARVFKEANQRLLDAKLIDNNEMSGTESLQRRKTVQRIKFDCGAIDSILDGGIELGSCTQIYGRDGGGKTQTSHLMALQVQRPIEQGGLAEEGKAPPLVYFIATENTWRPERIIEIAAGKGLIVDLPQELKTKHAEGKRMTVEEQTQYDEIKKQQEVEAEKYLDNIIIKRVSDADSQAQAVHDLIKMVQEIPFKLIVLDSGTALIRGSYMGQANMNPKFQLLNEMCQELLSIAELNKIAVLFVNQVYINPYPKMGESSEEPYGGKILGHAFPYILHVDKSGSRHRITIEKSPYQANNSVRFEIHDSGFVEVKEKEK